jgi:hypothetical protein
MEKQRTLAGTDESCGLLARRETGSKKTGKQTTQRGARGKVSKIGMTHAKKSRLGFPRSGFWILIRNWR